MRFIAAVAGIGVSIPLLLFFWVGTQTFIRSSERALAVMVTVQSVALLLFSATLLFMPSVQRLQCFLLIATAATVGIIFVAYGASK